MKQKYQDRIDDFVLGRMADEEQSIFEQEMKKDPLLREQTRFTNTVCKAVRSRNEMLEKMKAFKKKNEKEPERKDKPSSGDEINFLYSLVTLALVLS